MTSLKKLLPAPVSYTHLHDRIDVSAAIAADHPHNGACRHNDEYKAQSGRNAGAQSHQNARKEVSPVTVCPCPVLPGRRRKRGKDPAAVGVLCNCSFSRIGMPYCALFRMDCAIRSQCTDLCLACLLYTSISINLKTGLMGIDCGVRIRLTGANCWCARWPPHCA